MLADVEGGQLPGVVVDDGDLGQGNQAVFDTEQLDDA